MRILVAGGSGFLGRHLIGRLTGDGHDVVGLVRRPPSRPDEIRWDPAAGALEPAVLSGVDAVVNLAGAGVGDHRWTTRYKNLLVSSRVDTTSTLAKAIVAVPADARPRLLLNASAVGWYGDTGERPVDEEAPAGDGFLPDLCRVWEAATRPAEDAGTRVVRIRSGLVLHRDGGMLKPMLLQFRLGAGGKLGSGRQYMPWIALDDWLTAVVFLLARTDVAGPVNVVGPAPVTSAEFAKALGAELHRPSLLPVPAFALRLALGEFSVEALTSSRVLPGVLNRSGFHFAHSTLASALHAAVTQAE
jgi:uncharacterized protein (TIGR01777 family)